MSFANKSVLITGGAHGIGRAIAQDFLENGAKVTILDIDKEAGGIFAGQHQNLCFVHGDAASEPDLARFVETATQFAGTIDILVNNACVGSGGILSGCDSKAFDRTVAIGLRAPYLLTRLCLSSLKSQNGCIVNIASTRAFQSEPDTEAYAAAKGGLVALTHALAVSLGPSVRVNCVSPGWINTSGSSFEKPDHLQHPAGRIGTPADISAMVLFLCSSKASFITGQNFTVDGGISKRMIYSGDGGWSFSPETEKI